MNLAEKISEDDRIIGVQTELFSIADEADIRKALQLLKRYPELKIVVDDYRKNEQELKDSIYSGLLARKLNDDELHADLPPNSIILASNQKRAAEECEILKKALERAVGLIIDEESRTAIHLRYMRGYSYKETLMFMRHGVKSTTVDRRLKNGIVSVANTLKMWGLIES